MKKKDANVSTHGITIIFSRMKNPTVEIFIAIQI